MLPQMVDRFEMVELHRDERINRFDITHKPRLYAYYKSVHLLLHVFRKLSGRRDRSVYILTHFRARYRKSESDRELVIICVIIRLLDYLDLLLY